MKLKQVLFLLFSLTFTIAIIGQDQTAIKAEYKKAFDSQDWETAAKHLKVIKEEYFKGMNWDSLLYYNNELALVGEKSQNLELEIRGKSEALDIESYFSRTADLTKKRRAIFALIDTNRLNSAMLSALYQGQISFYQDLGKLDSALIRGKQSIYFADKSRAPEQMVMGRLSFANILTTMNRSGEAIQQLVECEEIVQNEYTEAVTQIRLYLETGKLLTKIEDFEKALYYLEKAKTITEANNFKTFTTDANMKIARVKYRQKKFDEAFLILTSCLEHYTNKRILSRRIGCLTVMAFVHNSRKDFTEFHKTIELLKKLSPKLSVGLRLQTGFVAISEGEYSKGLSIINEIKSENKLKDKNIRTLRRLEYQYYEKVNQPAEALKKYKEYTYLEDSMKQSNQYIITQRIESEYNRKKQDSEINSLNQINQAQDKALAVRNTALVMGIIMLLVLGGLLFGLYRLYQKNQKNQAQLTIQNKQISEALAQNKMLIKEIHHRVKNNLQVVTSLLSMQERKVTDVDTKDALKSSKTRVQSMSILHQNLYQGENLKEIDADTYIDQLVQNIKDTYSVDKDIKFNIDIDKVDLDIDTLIPLGLIVNELITNAIKHAFGDRPTGEISISLLNSGDQLKLIVKDNGIGLSSPELPNKPGSLGARLIKSFTKRLDGDLSVNVDNGTEIKISFVNDPLR